jgi:hypothetical protein
MFLKTLISVNETAWSHHRRPVFNENKFTAIENAVSVFKLSQQDKITLRPLPHVYN